MDQSQYTTLSDALQAIPDPRQARGKRYPWHFLLMLIALAVASGEQTVHAIANWAGLHADEWRMPLNWHAQSFPSESTVRRTLRLMPSTQLESILAGLPPVTHSASSPLGLTGQAVDGKTLRGASAHGQPIHLVSLVRHSDACIVNQVAVQEKSNEITAVPVLLTGRNLHATVTTMDALLTQRSLAQQILNQHGHYLMMVKANQPALYQAIAVLFQNPPWTKREQGCEYWKHRTMNKGHGRLEYRTLESSTTLCGYVDWPQVGQVMRRTCRRIHRKTGVVTHEIKYAITSLTPRQATAAQLEKFWRGHWTIENQVHYVRDVTMHEDAGQVRAGHAPQVLAALRNALLNLYRANGWHNISDAVRYYGSKVSRAFHLLTSYPARL
jgi:predicted transposase YbfD/YdcC